MLRILKNQQRITSFWLELTEYNIEKCLLHCLIYKINYSRIFVKQEKKNFNVTHLFLFCHFSNRNRNHKAMRIKKREKHKTHFEVCTGGG